MGRSPIIRQTPQLRGIIRQTPQLLGSKVAPGKASDRKLGSLLILMRLAHACAHMRTRTIACAPSHAHRQTPSHQSSVPSEQSGIRHGQDGRATAISAALGELELSFHRLLDLSQVNACMCTRACTHMCTLRARYTVVFLPYVRLGVCVCCSRVSMCSPCAALVCPCVLRVNFVEMCASLAPLRICLLGAHIANPPACIAHGDLTPLWPANDLCTICAKVPPVTLKSLCPVHSCSRTGSQQSRDDSLPTRMRQLARRLIEEAKLLETQPHRSKQPSPHPVNLVHPEIGKKAPRTPPFRSLDGPPPGCYADGLSLLEPSLQTCKALHNF